MKPHESAFPLLSPDCSGKNIQSFASVPRHLVLGFLQNIKE